MQRLIVFFALAIAAFAAGITGTWQFAVETDMGPGTPTVTFQQTDGKLTGTYSGRFGDAALAGTVDGNKVRFSFDVSPQGDKITVVYTGTIDGNKMKGTVVFGDEANGAFTAEKK